MAGTRGIKKPKKPWRESQRPQLRKESWERKYKNKERKKTNI